MVITNTQDSDHREVKPEPINLLWTGGWDSTFRLLQLLLEEKEVVQPYYIIDYRRKSIGMEFETMQYLRKKITDTFPETGELLLPTLHSELESIKPDEQITASYQKVLQYRHLGDQYEWLKRFCRQHQIENIELSVEGELHETELSFFPYIYNPEDYPTFVKPYYYDMIKPEMDLLLGSYDFPIKHMTKLMMLSYSKERGWMNGIMEKTWTCYRPTRLKNPCGLCTPCELIIENRMGWRIPIHRRSLFYLRKWKRTFFRNS